MPAPRIAALLMVSALGAGVGHAPAQADPIETEARLASAGVDAGIRARIRTAIDRGSRYLLARQEADGSFVERWTGSTAHGVDPVRTTLLCALALRHAGLPGADAAASRAATWALNRPPTEWGAPSRRVQSAGLALMLLASIPGHDERVPQLASALVAALDGETAYWGHNLPQGPVAQPDFRAELTSLGDSHLAALGLRAATMTGVELTADVWKRHAHALGTEQSRTGSWRWHPAKEQARHGKTVSARWDTGTPAYRFVGLANLFLARYSLRDLPAETRRIDSAINRAKEHLAADVEEFLADPAETLQVFTTSSGDSVRFPRGSHNRPGDGAYSGLFALAEACLFGDIAAFDLPAPAPRGGATRSWFAVGAEWLLRVQRPDGAWSPTAGEPVTDASETDTAYALLFLLRAPAAFHPVHPRPVDVAPLPPPKPQPPLAK